MVDAAKAIEAAGGKLHHYFFAFGEDDVVALFEAPDNPSAAGVALAVAAGGTVSSGQTTVLMTMDEAMECMRTAAKVKGSYQPPAG